MATRRLFRTTSRPICRVALAALLSLTPALGLCLGVSLTAAPAFAQSSGGDTIIFRSGKVVEGKILEESGSSVKIEIDVAGIKAVTTYQKNEILSITRAEKAPEAENAARTETAATAAPKTPPTASESASNASKVYVVELTGKFGKDISQTPLREAVRDAKRLSADYLIFVLDNDWSMKRYGQLEERANDESEFNALFRAEKINPTYTEEIEREWAKEPRVIFWVKKAMGGAAFLPLSVKEIYFHPAGRMGGIGKMEQGSTQADQVVREKWFGAGMAHAEGMAIKGGYDPRIVRAMARDDYILTVKFEGGRPVYYERMPEGAGEILLTDDGKESNEDSEQDLARGLGNDNLTIDADTAFKLGISKGTVDTLEDLLFTLGIARNHELVKGQSDRIMKGWRNGIEGSERELTRLWRTFGEAPDGGNTYQERTQNRGRRKRIIEDMQAILRRYEEAINPNALRIPDYVTLERMKSDIEFAQLADRR